MPSTEPVEMRFRSRWAGRLLSLVLLAGAVVAVDSGTPAGAQTFSFPCPTLPGIDLDAGNPTVGKEIDGGSYYVCTYSSKPDSFGSRAHNQAYLSAAWHETQAARCPLHNKVAGEGDNGGNVGGYFGNLVSTTKIARVEYSGPSSVYVKDPGARAAIVAPARALFAAVEARAAACPPAVPATVGPGAPTGALEVAVACDGSRLRTDGKGACSASVVGGAPNAKITYDWTIDGVPYSESHEDSVVFSSLAQERRHTVGVVARDIERNITSKIATATFGPRGFPWLVFGGGALAVAAAVAALLNNRRRRAPVGAGTLPEPPPVRLPPPTLPEVAVRNPNNANPTEPTLTLTLHVATSKRTEREHTRADPHIWGDDVDAALAGYDVTANEGWTVTRITETPGWSVTGGRCTPVQSFLHFPHLVGTAIDIPTSHRRVVLQANWAAEPGTLSVTLGLQVWVAGPGGERGPFPLSQATSFTVVGARPRLELYADKPGDADGTFVLAVLPLLEVFGTTYPGGLKALPIDNPNELEPFLDATAQEFRVDHPDGNSYVDEATDTYQAGYDVRCKFHLDGAALKGIRDGGVPVLFKVAPTGKGPGATEVLSRDPAQVDFDWMAADHYRSVATHLPTIAPYAPARVQLKPSTVTFDPLDPASLPSLTAELDAEYRTRIRATVRSASGAAVLGSNIRRDRPSGVGGVQTRVEGWKLTFSFPLPAKEPLRRWDPLQDETRRTFTIDVEDVSDKEPGRLTFQDAASAVHSYYDYDHWARFYESKERYLSGQCSTVQLTLEGRQSRDAFEIPGPTIAIGPPWKIYLYVYPMSVASTTPSPGHPFVGLIDPEGREARAGFYPVTKPQEASYSEIAGAVALGALAVGTVGWAVPLVAGEAAVWLAARLGLQLVTTGGVPVLWGIATQTGRAVKLAASAASGFGAIFMDLTDGPGMLRDEFTERSDYEVCQGWDITRREYEVARGWLTSFKARADNRETFYQIRTQLSDPETVCNCVTMPARLFRVLSIPFPTDPGAWVDSPTSVADGVRMLKRSESFTVDPPWCFPPRTRGGKQRALNEFLGATPPPSFSLTPQEKKEMTDAARKLVAPPASPGPESPAR